MPFFKSSSPRLNPAVVQFLAEAQDEGMSESEIRDVLMSNNINPDEYMEDGGYTGTGADALNREDNLGDFAAVLDGPPQNATSVFFGEDPAMAEAMREPGPVMGNGKRRPSWMPPVANPKGLPEVDENGEIINDPSFARPGHGSARGGYVPDGPMSEDAPAMSVADTITDDTEAMPDESVDVAGDAAPKVAIAPKDQPSMFARLKSAFGDSDLAQALMATGFGIMGAQGTYGNTAQAIGQGGMEAMKQIERSSRRKSVDKFRRDQLASVENRDKTAKSIARDRLKSEDENRKAQRLQDRAQNVLKLVDAGNAAAANAALAKDPELRSIVGIPDGVNLKDKPMSLSDFQGLTWSGMSKPDQEAALKEKGKDGEKNTREQIMAKFRLVGWEGLSGPEQELILPLLRDPDAEAAGRITNDPMGDDRFLPADARVKRTAEVAESIRGARRNARGAGSTGGARGAGGGSSKAPLDRVLKNLGVQF